uniref:Ankyrin repeat domain 2 n=1 Tax=Strigops habroptila TaxID=2489341 RepID=A0A672VEZ7_STRHB
CALQADMELDVQRAKELIEQKLGKGMFGGVGWVPGHRGGKLGTVGPPQGQERVRRSSVDLRREIIDVGSIQRLIELRKQRRQRREERVATPEPPPPPESLEIEGPVEPETFLRAAVQGKMHIIEKFLADGGSPNTCDEFHRTALHRSSLEGHTDILQKLLDSGATVDFRDRLDCTAVHWACRGGHLDAVKLLQDRGADLNVRDKEGDTALHDATRLSRYKIIKMLLLHGADMMAKNQVSSGTGTAAIFCTTTSHHPDPSLSLPALAGWQDPDGPGAAVAGGHAPGAGDQGAATGRDRGSCVTAPGRNQGPGSAPTSRIQPRLFRVNKSQQRAAFVSMGLGKLGYWGAGYPAACECPVS